jgi:hypothetical protein
VTLDLLRPYGFGELLAVSLRTWVRHLPLFLTLALIVVAPLYVLLDWQVYDLEQMPGGWAYFASTLEHGVVIPALVTAMHVVAVQDLGRGERPRIGHAAAVAVRLAPRLMLVVLLYAALIGLGILACIIPGLIAFVRLFFAPQAAVVDGSGVYDSLHDSGELTGEGRWVRTGAVLVLLSVVGYGINAGAGALLAEVGSDAVAVVLGILQVSVVISLWALVGTLLFFDLRARRRANPPAAAAGSLQLTGVDPREHGRRDPA